MRRVMMIMMALTKDTDENEDTDDDDKKNPDDDENLDNDKGADSYGDEDTDVN